MMMLAPSPLVQRYALIGHCENASLLAKADALVAADRPAQALLCKPGAAVSTDIQTRLRDGVLRLKQILWTVQVPLRSAPGLQARTLCLGPEKLCWFDLADDPALHLDEAFADPGTRILRYIPGRRATAMMAGSGEPIIQKFKKKERLVEAISRHRMVERAASGQHIPIPRLQTDQIGYCLTFCQGEALEGGLANANRLEALGSLIARLHDCDPAGLPEVDVPNDPLPWLQAAIPGLAPRLQRIWDALPKGNEKHLSLCHGDLSLAQVLVDRRADQDHLTLLDFDRAGAGDAGRDLATLLCGLQDAALDHSFNAEQFVIAGYSRISSPPANLRPARAMAELERLRHLIRKGGTPSRRVIAGLEKAEAASLA